MKMLKVKIICTLFFFVLFLQGNAQSFKTGYCPVNGLKMYYEIHGAGEPIVLLHGAYMTIEGPIRQMIEVLKKNRQVIVVELQGHGRTADINRDITYEGMADDVAAFLKYMRIESADIFGYSMGACTAMQLAFRHSQVAKKLVLVSGA